MERHIGTGLELEPLIRDARRPPDETAKRSPADHRLRIVLVQAFHICTLCGEGGCGRPRPSFSATQASMSGQFSLSASGSASVQTNIMYFMECSFD
ncbi:hypothetical protein ACQEVF_45810 [Nonomuraea polychroma]|uniref:hypothetical protein n=1 Tax=Nonomuraea polychroma TaxID=46176 RepID=UPI003D8E4AD7